MCWFVFCVSAQLWRLKFLAARAWCWMISQDYLISERAPEHLYACHLARRLPVFRLVQGYEFPVRKLKKKKERNPHNNWHRQKKKYIYIYICVFRQIRREVALGNKWLENRKVTYHCLLYIMCTINLPYHIWYCLRTKYRWHMQYL